MNQVIADVQSVNGAFDISQMQELRESLACVESLANLFPDDLESSVKEMSKIASGFLNHSADATQGVTQDQIKEEMLMILSIIKAGECTVCESGAAAVTQAEEPA